MFKKLEQILTKINPKESTLKLILIVEDSEVDRRIIEQTVQRAGYQSVLAENGKKGLEMVKKERPDLIILDCEMPVMGGKEMCESLKNDLKTQNIPIIFLTSIDTPDNIVECFELEAQNFLRKPLQPRVLISHIKTILNALN